MLQNASHLPSFATETDQRRQWNWHGFSMELTGSDRPKHDTRYLNQAA
jgi:hypothetical protein